MSFIKNVTQSKNNLLIRLALFYILQISPMFGLKESYFYIDHFIIPLENATKKNVTEKLKNENEKDNYEKNTFDLRSLEGSGGCPGHTLRYWIVTWIPIHSV